VLIKVNNKEVFCPRIDFGVSVLKGTIYLVGGFDKNENKLSDVWSSTDGGKTWKQLLENAPFGKIWAFQLIAFQDKL